MLNRICMILMAFIMNACVCEFEEGPMQSGLQQKSKSGLITPMSGAAQGINFQLPQFLDHLGKPDPGNYTIQFGLEDPNVAADLGASGFIRARGEIIWKVGGQDVRRVVDVGNGVSISGTVEGVSAKIYDDSVGAPSGRPYFVSMQVVKGSRPSVQQPPVYSLNAQTVEAAGAAGLDVDIPQNIGAISVNITLFPVAIGTAIGAYDIKVSQLTPNNTVRRAYDPRQDQWVPLAPGATKLRFITSAAGPQTNLQIAFGIDG